MLTHSVGHSAGVGSDRRIHQELRPGAGLGVCGCRRRPGRGVADPAAATHPAGRAGEVQTAGRQPGGQGDLCRRQAQPGLPDRALSAHSRMPSDPLEGVNIHFLSLDKPSDVLLQPKCLVSID